MTSHDRRQFLLMQSLIESFRAGQLELGLLVRDLEAISQALDEHQEAFSEAFHQHWFDLEQVLAVALDRTYDEVLAENHDLVERATGKLDALVREQLVKPEE